MGNFIFIFKYQITKMFFDQREPSQRQNNNTKTTFSFSDPQKKQKYDYGTQAVRQRQFED